MAYLSILDAEYPLSDEQIGFYRQNAYIKLKNVITPDVISHFSEVITDSVTELNAMHLPLEERSTYDKAFLQVMNMWTKDEVVKRLVFSRRLAEIATVLMGTDGVRLYHDQALYKEPGGGFTPWHADQFYWPLANSNTITVWIPLQATPLEMGPLEFSARSHAISDGRDIGISDESEERIEALLARSNVMQIVEPFDLGEVSYHAGWCFHRAGPNATDIPRKVMTVIYMDKEMRLKAPQNDNQQADWDAWLPGSVVGELIDTPLNPVLYDRSDDPLKSLANLS